MNVQRGSLLASAEQVQGLPIIIDVLRAFTSSPVLFSLGIESLILVSTAEEAFALREKHGYLLAGENNGVKIEGFDFGNSPSELLRLPTGILFGKTVVLRTSAGTQGVVAAIQHSGQVILGSFVMAKAIAAYVKRLNPDTVSLVAMGQRLLEKAPEDEACAAYLDHLLTGKPYDHYAALWECLNAPLIHGWLHGGAEHIPPEDIFLCLQRDLFDFVLIAERDAEGLIRVQKISTKVEAKPLGNEQLQRLLNFKGYGRVEAPIWFIGMEEGVGGNANDEALLYTNIMTRVEKYDRDVMDMVVAHKAMDYHIDQLKASPTQVWTWMAKIALALSDDLAQSPLEYIRTQLGRTHGCTFLTELLPIPVVNNDSWPHLYGVLTPYQNRDEYWDAVIEPRKQMLNDLINQNEPRYIFAYGKRYHAVYRDLFTDVKFKKVRSFLIGQRNHTTIILSPFFGVGALSTTDFETLIEYLTHQPSYKHIDCKEV